ncbi:DEAD/DEAH box helicase [Candidatus Woesearchaeota archaeon]|jgi:superfamily II RNA helicase|nr:DEAD/DEAH box helicase [Candidatus Woesearchaeota archaeon]MBT4698164.1 DEAD/DEAH box helicase [Candidatus Woesearchaeota archaeon]MBT4716355.1 DEAD/DEAH box helicase [Candidatus Woesearchaeota archaeon]MBT7930303.1 DEAD/DEAH box helicase [Candidatus Woesearchaeota archaeon]
MRYKNFELDKFQEDSIHSIEKNNSVVVSAATGTGKTLIADYIINKAIKEDKRVVYTAPIKALSNQKFREFKEDYGDKIGLLTGDVTINDRAQILIMTTEIYRNMLLSHDPVVDEITYVIFDEIHFLSDIERGTVWEESIIFSPENVRFLCLSATIPNAKQFGQWIQEVKGHTVDLVTYMKRAVPLNHYVFDINEGITTAKELKPILKYDNSFPSYEKVMSAGGKKRKKRIRIPVPSHIDLIEELEEKGQLPAFFFCFSRKACQTNALALVDAKLDFTTDEEKAEIISFINKNVTDGIKHLSSVSVLKKVLTKGIGIHHAGLLPILKEIVEKLFNKGIIKVLYTTETFAVGINMPAKTVCFGSMEKYDGISFRYLNSKEYFQIAGRAGRRGIDEFGRAIVIIDRNNVDLDKVIKITSKDVDPMVSRFDTSYNTVVNLISAHDPDKIERILRSNFGFFVKRQSAKQSRIITSYKNKVRQLKKLGHVDKEGKLTPKGKFTTMIYSHELEIGEMVFNGVLDGLSDVDVLILIAALEYEPRMSDKFNFQNIDKDFNRILKSVSKNKILSKRVKRLNVKRMVKLFKSWANGATFESLMKNTNLLEGDIIRLFRRVIDVLKQIAKATDNYELKDRMLDCIHKLDRDVVKVEF